jgi:hypothetical protein
MINRVALEALISTLSHGEVPRADFEKMLSLLDDREFSLVQTCVAEEFDRRFPANAHDELLSKEEKEMVLAGRTVDAIRRVRDRLGLGLKESKDRVETWNRRRRA